MKHLVLLGAGHAHIQVLRAFGRAPPGDARITLVSPYPRFVYSGMVPGVIAGHYAPGDAEVAIAPLAERAGARFVVGEAVAMDAAARRVRLADGGTIGYDVLGIDIGATIDRDAIPGAREHALAVRPIERVVPRLLQRLGDGGAGRRDVVVVGAGAGGVEIALAVAHRLGARARVGLVTGGTPPLPDHPSGAQARAQRALQRAGVTLHRERCAAVGRDHLVLDGGSRLACDVALLATGAAAPRWLAASGLALDAAGFVATGATLQSCSHPEVFAAGDAASRPDAPRPRSGVHAVRAGPPLALNLRRFAAGRALAAHRPQRRALNLLACGERRAIASWGCLSAEARWIWWWKDRIDRGFVAGLR